MANLVKEVQASDEQEDSSIDTSDPQEVNKQRKKYARTRAVRLEFVEAALSTEQGRAWYYDLLKFCNIFDGTYEGDPYRSYFLQGMRNVGLRVLDDIQTVAPDNYLKMIKEQKTKNG